MAGRFAGVQDHEPHATLGEVVADGKACLAATDDDDDVERRRCCPEAGPLVMSPYPWWCSVSAFATSTVFTRFATA